MPLRVVFFGNSESVFSNRFFQAVLDAPCEPAAVVDAPPGKRTSTNPAPAIEPSNCVLAARRRGIPVFEPTSPNLPAFVEQMRKLWPDVFLAIGYTNLLKPAILSVPRIVSANFHASLLPAYRGLHPVFWVLRNGERWSGLTVHAMDPGLDTGDILYQVRVRTRKHDTVSTLYDRIIERGLALVGRLLDDAARGRLRRRAQGDDGASYYSSPRDDDFRLDWRRDAESLRQWIQTTPGTCFFEIGTRRIHVTEAYVVSRSNQTPGILLRVSSAGAVIAAGRAALRLRRVRAESGAEQSVYDLCHDLGLRPGQVLPYPADAGLASETAE